MAEKIEIVDDPNIIKGLISAIVLRAYSDYVHDIVLIKEGKQQKSIKLAESDMKMIERLIKGAWYETKFKEMANKHAEEIIKKHKKQSQKKQAL